MNLHKQKNLVCYFILPLTGVNISVFGRKYKEAFIDKKGQKVYVQLSSEMESLGYRKINTFLTTLTINKKHYVVYNVPTEFSHDAKLFLEGKYSQISRVAKKIIYKTSTLPYNKNYGDFKQSSPILQALDKTQTLRTFLETNLGITALPESAELLEIPRESWFIENVT